MGDPLLSSTLIGKQTRKQQAQCVVLSRPVCHESTHPRFPPVALGQPIRLRLGLDFCIIILFGVFLSGFNWYVTIRFVVSVWNNLHYEERQIEGRLPTTRRWLMIRLVTYDSPPPQVARISTDTHLIFTAVRHRRDTRIDLPALCQKSATAASHRTST